MRIEINVRTYDSYITISNEGDDSFILTIQKFIDGSRLHTYGNNELLRKDLLNLESAWHYLHIDCPEVGDIFKLGREVFLEVIVHENEAISNSIMLSIHNRKVDVSYLMLLPYSTCTIKEYYFDLEEDSSNINDIIKKIALNIKPLIKKC